MELMESKYNYLNPQDLARCITAIPLLHIRKWLDSDIMMLFKIMYWCALRPSEGIYLSKEDFHLDSNEVKLGKTKTSAIDYAPIPRPFIPELKAYLDTKENGRLFPDLKYITFYLWTRRLGVLLNIEAWTTKQSESKEKTKGHIFRKSIGKDMLFGVHGKALQDISIISKQLRHKKPSMTIDHYLNSSIEAVKEAWAKENTP